MEKQCNIRLNEKNQEILRKVGEVYGHNDVTKTLLYCLHRQFEDLAKDGHISTKYSNRSSPADLAVQFAGKTYTLVAPVRDAR